MRALLAATLILLCTAPAASGEVGHLVGTVGPGFTIGLTDASGRHVDQVVAGRYELVIHDLSDQHNFVLGEKSTGNRPAQTEVPFVGDATFTVDLRPGLWAYACSPHFDVMNGLLLVLPPPTLTARLTATGATLSVKRASAGAYTITVVDRSRTQGFRLVGPGVSRHTGAAYTGTAAWAVELTAGTYRFGGATLTGKLVVTQK